jgi:hypothetical protein
MLCARPTHATYIKAPRQSYARDRKTHGSPQGLEGAEERKGVGTLTGSFEIGRANRRRGSLDGTVRESI